MNEPIQDKMASVFDGVRADTREDGLLEINAGQGEIMALLSFLKNNGFAHLAMISCVDRIDQEKLELVYILSRYLEPGSPAAGKENVNNVILKTVIDRQAPLIISVIPIFENAEPYEREIHELFGVNFEGHPRLTPLFLEREYETPPFRKDFDTREYVRNTFDAVPEIEKEAGKK